MTRRKLSKEVVSKIAKTYRTRGEFQLGDKSAYLSAYTKGWLDDICSHMPKPRVLDKEAVLKIASQFSTRGEFAINDDGAYKAARKKGWLDEACGHMTAQHRTLDKETIAASAKRFQTRGEFEEADSYAHKIASKNGWLDEVCSHMTRRFRKHTKESVYEIAKKFKSRGDFQRGDAGAYRAAFNRGWLDDICQHMPQAITGFDTSKPGYVYQIQFIFPNGESVWKIGITNLTPARRLRELSAPDWLQAKIVNSTRYSLGIDAREQEKRLHAFGKEQGFIYEGDPFLKSGNSELFTQPLM